MRRFSLIVISLAAVFFILSCNKQQEKAIEDISMKYPEKAKVVFENEYVKAVKFTLKPGESLPLHKGHQRVVAALSDYKINWTEGDVISEKEWEKGDVHWHDAIEHAIKNTGNQVAEFITVARKNTVLPGTDKYDVSRDISAIDSAYSKISFENDYVRVIETKIPPQISQNMHHGINRLIYALSDYHIKYTSDKTETKEMQITAGTAHWHGADEHAVENISTSPAKYLIFAFKK